MPIAVRAREADALAPMPRKRWTRAECAELAKVIDLHRYELINGELYDKMGKNERHVLAVGIILDWLKELFGRDSVFQEAPVDLRPEDRPTSDPEPDVTVTRRPRRECGLPGASDLLLVVEVADTTAALDLGAKRDLYARAGIADYWVLDLSRRRVVVHREPAEGAYQRIEAYGEDEIVTPQAAPGSGISVREVMG